ncbi:MAG: aminotransferase class IV [Spirochaetaceae bacterium]|jgi:D-alanine transaminase|nr:aminotransferase class IV [Spirochaetaceae bacterium]
MKSLGYYNGEYGPLDEMRIPMNDRVCWFGDGVYEATPCANRRIFALDEHIDRFFKSAELLNLRPELTKTQLADLLHTLVLKVDSPEQSVYWQLTRGTADRAHPFPEGVSPNLWVMLRPWKQTNIYEKIRLITAEDTRFLHCNIKTLNLLPNVMASEKAKQAGCQEAVFHRGTRVTEGTHSNVHILKNGVFLTAPTDNLILPGIARSHLIAQCKKLGVPVSETPFTVPEMFRADEVLTSSASTLCLSVSHINGQAVGGAAPELLGQLQDSVLEEFRRATAPALEKASA